MSRNAKSRRYKQRHGIVRSKGIICNQCYGHVKRALDGLPPVRFTSKALRSASENQS